MTVTTRQLLQFSVLLTAYRTLSHVRMATLHALLNMAMRWTQEYRLIRVSSHLINKFDHSCREWVSTMNVQLNSVGLPLPICYLSDRGNHKWETLKWEFPNMILKFPGVGIPQPLLGYSHFEASLWWLNGEVVSLFIGNVCAIAAASTAFIRSSLYNLWIQMRKQQGSTFRQSAKHTREVF